MSFFKKITFYCVCTHMNKSMPLHVCGGQELVGTCFFACIIQLLGSDLGLSDLVSDTFIS